MPSAPLPESIAPLPGWRRHQLAAGLGLLATGWLLGIIVLTLGPERTGELQLDIVLSHHRSEPWVALARGLNWAGSPVVAPWVVAVVAAIIAFGCGWRRAAAYLGLVLAAWLSVVLVKDAFNRPRPPADEVFPVVAVPSDASFPSGHTAFAAYLVIAAALALAAYPRIARTLLWVGAAFAFVMAGSRLLLGVHFLGDVVAAPCIALGSLLVADWAATRRIRTSREAEGTTAPLR